MSVPHGRGPPPTAEKILPCWWNRHRDNHRQWSVTFVDLVVHLMFSFCMYDSYYCTSSSLLLNESESVSLVSRVVAHLDLHMLLLVNNAKFLLPISKQPHDLFILSSISGCRILEFSIGYILMRSCACNLMFSTGDGDAMPATIARPNILLNDEEFFFVILVGESRLLPAITRRRLLFMPSSSLFMYSVTNNLTCQSCNNANNQCQINNQRQKNKQKHWNQQYTL